MALTAARAFNFTNRIDLMYCGGIRHGLHGHGIYERVQVHLSSNEPFLLVAQISIVLVISLCIQILFKPFKQPRFISDMIAGLIIGPSFLGQYNEFSSLLFPKRSKYMLQTMTQMAMMLFFFVNGIQMNITMIWKGKRRAYFIGLMGVFLPIMVISMAVRDRKHYLQKYFPNKFKDVTGILATSISVTSVHVLYPILKELNLLETDIGRLSISSCAISDVVGFFGSISVGLQRQTKGIHKLAYLSGYFGIIFVCFSIIRPAAKLVNRRTPNGGRVKHVYIMMFLFGIMVAGYVSDMFGSSIVQGPVMLALAIPEGPPLGAALVKRTEAVMNNIFMPVLYAQAGLICDLPAIWNDWVATKSLLEVVFIGYLAKFFTSMMASFFAKMPIRDAISLGLVMSFRSQAELSTFVRWNGIKMLEQSAFTVMVLCTTIVTSISAFLLRFIYIPTLSYMTNKPRTILHSGPNTKFNLVACFYNQETVPALINLLKASNPTIDSPVSVYILQLVELIGKYKSIFINHNDRNNNFSNQGKYSSNVVWKAFEMFKQTIGNEYISFHMFTVVSPYKIMYHEICKLALDKKATMIILPVPTEYNGDVPLGTSSTYYASKVVNSDVMAHAPCSVGFLLARDPKPNILVCDSTNERCTMPIYRVILLFLGGADAREALAYADLMVSQENVCVTVIRFLAVVPSNDDSKFLDDDKFDLMEYRLDEECYSWFVTKNLKNDRIGFKDVEVKDGVELIYAIRGIDRDGYDLWMVGRERGMNPILVQGLGKEAWMSNSCISDLNHHPELGVIGDFISSPDFEGSFSLLVVQQQLHDKL